MKKIIIIGSRRRNEPEDFQKVYNEFKQYYQEGDIIVSGGCPKGGDRFAEIIAERLGMTEANGKLILHRPGRLPSGSPVWEYTKAFYERNTLVAREVESDSIVIACCALDRTGGTEDTIRKIRKLGRVQEINIRVV
jgi:hypothetical protein